MVKAVMGTFRPGRADEPGVDCCLDRRTNGAPRHGRDYQVKPEPARNDFIGASMWRAFSSVSDRDDATANDNARVMGGLF
jgi:hypothetical protein